MHDVTVRYPFHPLAGQSFVVLGQYEHYGALHVLVRGADGATHLFPAWMATTEAAAAEIVVIPRLPIQRLIDLRERDRPKDGGATVAARKTRGREWNGV
jgi:hypothetical protein